MDQNSQINRSGAVLRRDELTHELKSSKLHHPSVKMNSLMIHRAYYSHKVSVTCSVVDSEQQGFMTHPAFK